MINSASCKLLGVATRPVGTKGKLQLKLEKSSNAGLLIIGNPVFFLLNGLLVPFIIEDVHSSGNNATIKLEFVDAIEDSERLCNNPVYVEKTKRQKAGRIKTGDDNELEGYSVSDLNYGFAGIVTQISYIPENPLLVLNKEGKEYLIPAHDDFIVSIDDKNKIILIHMPDGFFEIF